MNNRMQEGTFQFPGRRQFLSAAAATGAALTLDSPLCLTGQSSAATPPEPSRKLHVRPRYYRWYVNPGVEWVETNTGYARLDWTMPLSQAALILVDIWDHHYLKDTEARAEAVIGEKLVPLLHRCRAAGMAIIHAPSPPQAVRHPNWVNAGRASTAKAKPADWPPPEFRSKSGPYQAYRRPPEPRDPELARLRAGLKIHPKVLPTGAEPVVATGEELHQLCQRLGVLFLFFAGFNTNACILVRDYGTLEMSRRGYEVLLA